LLFFFYRFVQTSCATAAAAAATAPVATQSAFIALTKREISVLRKKDSLFYILNFVLL